MRLREHTLFVKFSTQKDIVADAALLSLLDDVCELTGVCPAWFEDLLEVRGRRRAWDDEVRARVGGEWMSGGLMQRVRVRWSTEQGDTLPMTLEISAGSHPYAGGMVASIDWRVSEAWASEHVEAVVELCRDWQRRWTPLYLHAHLTDDHSIQNCVDPGMLRLGFGVDATAVDERRPGREVSRGVYRYAACWLTGVGPGLWAKCEAAWDDELDVRGAPPVEPQELDNGQRLFRLAMRPDEMQATWGRDRQVRLREYLGYDRLAAEEKWTMGFWQRD